jgi:hypothetical protein
MGYMGAEHGVGWAVMSEIKRALDPDGLMNPGKIVPSPNDPLWPSMTGSGPVQRPD